MLIPNWLSRLTTRRNSRPGMSRRRPRNRQIAQPSLSRSPNVLEDRTLLSGVTLITHGFQLFTGYPEWVDLMGDAVSEKIGAMQGESSADVARYHIEVGDLPWLSNTIERQLGSATVDAAETGEVVVTIDWSDISSLVPEVPTSSVAESIAQTLQSAFPAIGISQPLAQLPVHLIGHSRGASVMGALAEDLGQTGIWVDQVTFLDAHPIPFDWGELGVIEVPQNVVFADSYWRSDPNPADFDGETVDGAYDIELNFGFDETCDPSLVCFLDEAGYGHEHSDAHLWYHGTIDTTDTSSDGTHVVPAGWYDGNMGPRDEIGFNYSRIGDGGRPSDGLSVDLGGQGVREPIVDHTNDRWPSLVNFRVVPDDRTIALGEALDVDFLRRDFDSHSTFSLFLDDDENPYNNSPGQRQIGADASYASTGDQLISTDYSVLLNGVDVGEYFVFGRISDQSRTRYVYATDKMNLTADPASLVDLFGSSAAAPSGTLRPGEQFNFAYQISNRGTDDPGTFAVEWYLSPDSNISKSDLRLGRQNVLGLAAGATTPAEIRSLVLPALSNSIWNGNGTYYVGMIVDPDGAVSESNEANNRNAGLGLDFDSIEITGIAPPPNSLVVTVAADVDNGNVAANDLSLREAIRLANENPGNAAYRSIAFDIGVMNPEIDLQSDLGQLAITSDVNIFGSNMNAAGGTVRIDGQDAGRLFAISSPTTDVQLSNLTLAEGSSDGFGGAILMDDGGTLSIFNSLILGNHAADEGGAIYSKDGVVTIDNTTVRTNTSSDHGAGLYITNGTLLIRNGSRISDNVSTKRGGGIYSSNSTVVITDSTIAENTADGTGGGIRNSGGSLSITRSSVLGNESETDQGGGIYSLNGTVLITNSVLRQNVGMGSGGGLYARNGSLNVLDTTVSENDTMDEGGGIFASGASGSVWISGSLIARNVARSGAGIRITGSSTTRTILNSTISENSATEHAGGLELSGPVQILNSTITRNRADSDGNNSGDGGGLRSGGSVIVTNTIVAGNLQGTETIADDIEGSVSGFNNLIGDATSAGGLSNAIYGNIVGNNGTGTIPIDSILDTELDDHSGPTETHALVADSSAIDSGTSDGAPEIDQRGISRPQDGIGDGIAVVDIGAYEHAPPSLDSLEDLTIDKNADQQTVNLGGIAAGGGESRPLKVTASSNNTELITDLLVTYMSAEATGTLKFTPLTDQTGTATITVTVEDSGLDGDLETTNDNATISRTFDVTIESTPEPQPVRPGQPYTQDFSSGKPTPAQGWQYYSDNEGRIEVVNSRLRGDDQTGNDTYSLNEAILHLDLAGQSDVQLRVDHWVLSDEEHTLPVTFTGHHNGDGGAMSADGITWYSLQQDFSTSGTITVDLDDAIGRAGIEYTSNFRIKFQQFDNDPAPDDGRELDNVYVEINSLKILGPVGVSSEQRPTVTWTSVSDATSYEIWTEQIGGSNNPLVNPTVSGTSYTFMQDLGIGAYRTWVRATLSNGVKTNWARQNFQVSLAPELVDLSYRDPDRTPTISWEPIPGALQYRLYVSNLTVGGPAVIDELTTETSFTPTEDFGFGRYRIWCRAIGVGNYAAAWSSPEKYYVGTDPVSPTLSTFNNQPAFQWESMPGISSFQLYVQKGQSVPINVSGLTETSYTPDTPLGVGLHRWWIRPFHQSGRAGDWSHHAELHVGGQPNITAPSGTVDDSTPTLAWEPVDGAGSYEVYLYNDDGLGLVHRRTNITQLQMRLPLMPDGNFRVWVKSYKADGNHGLWSRSQSFVIDAATSQVTATPVSPLTPTFDRTPAFVWDGSSQAVSYDLYLTDGTEIVEFTGSSTSFVPQTELAIGDWKWWVRAVDSHSDKGEWSAGVSLHVGGRPNVLAPIGSTNTTTPTIRWTVVEGAGRYILLLETLAGVSIFRDNNLTATEYTLDVPSGEYRIWVKAISAADDFSGFWSRPVEFSVTKTKDRLQQGKSTLDVTLIHNASFLPTVTPGVLPENRRDEDVTNDTVAENAEVSDSETEMQSSISISSADHDVALGSQAAEASDHPRELLDNLMTTLGETSPSTCLLDFVRIG